MKLAALLLALCSALAQAAEPLVIAHRGASGYLPEHTLAGYELAIRMGADYIEPDLQMTQDGVLVAMHDATLLRTTNVAELFAPRGDGGQGGYRVADFTLAEIRTLTVKPTTTGAATHPGFTPASPEPRVPTFDEVIAFTKAQRAATGRTIGLYPEAKQVDAAMEDRLLASLQREKLTRAADRVFIQSFSDATVKSLEAKQRALGMSLPLVQLGHAITLPDGSAMMAVPGGRMLSLKDVAAYASGVGVAITNAKYPLTKHWIDQAHDAGLKVHGWTFAKADPVVAAEEYRSFLDMGLDGLFSNYSDLAVKARNAFAAGRK
ncbi:MAG: glycerophosphodiester phosphodiesterase family protein [Pseudomonadota bacterium]